MAWPPERRVLADVELSPDMKYRYDDAEANEELIEIRACKSKHAVTKDAIVPGLGWKISVCVECGLETRAALTALDRAHALIEVLNAKGCGRVLHGALQVAIIAEANDLDAKAERHRGGGHD